MTTMASAADAVLGEEKEEHHEDAAVGSISHILKTIFRGLYEETAAAKVAELAAKAAAAEAAEAAAAALLEEQEEARRREEEEAAEAAKTSSKTKKKTPPPRGSLDDDDDDDDDDDEDEDNFDAVVEKVEEHEEVEELPYEPSKEEDLSSRRWYSSLTAKDLGDAEETMQVATKRRRLIDARLAVQKKQSEALLGYLATATTAAMAADVEAETALKLRGLLVKAHVPVAASTLDLSGLQDTGGDYFANSLVTAAELVRMNRAAVAERSGMTIGAPQRKKNDVKPPGYLKLTSTNTVRREMVKQRSVAAGRTTKEFTLPLLAAATAKEQEGEEEEEFEKKKKPEASSSLEQKDLDMKMLGRMDSRLHYLRNPRYDPDVPNQLRRLVTKPPQPPMMEEPHMALVATPTPKKGRSFKEASFAAEGTMTTRDPILVADPASLIFDAYDLSGDFYEKTVFIRNVSAITRRLRYFEPRGSCTTIVGVKWPTAAKLMPSGSLAPGLALKLTVRFAPSSLADYDDVLILESESGLLEVPLLGRRVALAKVDLPTELDLGATHVGAKRQQVVTVTNIGGGPGDFRIFHHPDSEEEEGTTLVMANAEGVFEVSPSTFRLEEGEFMELALSFAPFLQPGLRTTEFCLVGDDERVSTHTLRGTAEICQVNLEEQEAAIDLEEHDVAFEVAFESSPLGTTSIRALPVKNAGFLDLECAWQIYDGSVFQLEGPDILDAQSTAPCRVTFTPAAVGPVNAEARLVIFGVPRAAVPEGAEIIGDDDLVVDFVACRLNLSGAGEFVQLQVTPEDKVEAFDLVLGLAYELNKQPIMLTNPTSATVRWRWGSACDLEGEPLSMIELEPDEGVLGPNSTVECLVSVRAERAGFSLARLPVLAATPDDHGEYYESGSFALRTEQSGGSLDFSERVDLGLVATGAVTDATLELYNSSNAPLAFAIVEGALRSDAPAPAPAPRSLEEGEALAAELSFMPASGTVAAGGTLTVLVSCRAGCFPEQVNPIVTVRTRGCGRDLFYLEDEQEFSSHPLQIRCSVVQPAVRLSKTDLQLGTVYVGVGVERKFTLANMSELSTTFDWGETRRVGGVEVSFRPSRGELSGKESVEISISVKAGVSGFSDASLQCAVEGRQVVTLRVRATAKAAVVSCELLAEGEDPPLPLASPNAPQLPAGLELPKPAPPPKVVEMGTVQLFQRNSVRFVLRNFSAVAAKFHIKPKKFPTAKQGSSDVMVTKSKNLLDGSLEPGRVFTSEAGQEHLRKRREAAEDAELLAMGRGAAFEVVTKGQILLPWSVAVVEVRSFNDTAGDYSEELECHVESAPTLRLPVKLKVRGNPLFLRQECPGLDLRSKAQPVLRFGELLLNGPQNLQRLLRVTNAGPVEALLKFRLAPPLDESEDETLVQCKVKMDEEGVKLTIGWRERKPYEPPFELDKESLRIPAHSEGSVCVTLPTATVKEGSAHLKKIGEKVEVRGSLVADVEYFFFKQPVDLMDSSSVHQPSATSSRKSSDEDTTLAECSSVAPLASSTKGALRVALEALVTTPHLDLEKEGEALRFKTTSITKQPVRKRCVLRNSSNVPMDCLLSVEPRCFSIKEGKEMMIRVGPLRTLTVEVVFTPPRELPEPPHEQRNALAPLEAQRLKYEYEGALRIDFSTGHNQTLQLQGVLLRPALQATPPCHDFGLVRVAATTKPLLTCFLANPTTVDAEWSLVHTPSDLLQPGSIDDPSVFSWDETSGLRVGPCLPLSTAAACMPKDFNRTAEAEFQQTLTELTWKKETTIQLSLKKQTLSNPRLPTPLTVIFSPQSNLRYTSRFRFNVRGGEGFDVLLSGHGTFEEDVIDPVIRIGQICS